LPSGADGSRLPPALREGPGVFSRFASECDPLAQESRRRHREFMREELEVSTGKRSTKVERAGCEFAQPSRADRHGRTGGGSPWSHPALTACPPPSCAAGGAVHF
jgi:hypothetical protein